MVEETQGGIEQEGFHRPALTRPSARYIPPAKEAALSRLVPEGFSPLNAAPPGPASFRVGPDLARGLPWVLLPGIEGDARLFAHQVGLSRLAPTFALDLPTGEDRLDRMAAVLATRLDALWEARLLPARRVALIGCSLGGLVARALAAADPDRVAALVTLGTLPAAACIPAAIRRGRRLAALLPDPLFRWSYARRIGQRLAEEGVAPALAAELVAGLPPRAELLRRLDAVLAWGLPDRLGVPTLALVGQSDREAPWSAADLTRHLPEAAFSTIPGGHRAPLTHPDGFQAALVSFLLGRR